VTNATLVSLFFIKKKPLNMATNAIKLGSFQGRCVVCGGPGVSDAYYCVGCTRLEKDREGCPKIINLGSSKTDLFYERKKFGFKKR
jgi:PHD finger-like domain-containing protein 5A